jgi:hypothetical protein
MHTVPANFGLTVYNYLLKQKEKRKDKKSDITSNEAVHVA